ncbi:MAG: hypothetical protein ACJ8J0_06905 [Longimicrobiaceae bacterium]
MIEILYKRRSEDGVQRLLLTPEEYYDPLEPGESSYEDSIPRFDHTADYLDGAVDGLEWIRVAREDGSVLLERFSSQGRVTFWHLRGADGGEELCLSTTYAPGRYHLTRLYRDPAGDWIPRWVILIDDQPDGSQTEEKLFP